MALSHPYTIGLNRTDLKSLLGREEKKEREREREREREEGGRASFGQVSSGQKVQ